MAIEAELDDLTEGQLRLGGMNTELQNGWGASSNEYESTEVVAQGRIRKKTKLAMVRHIQGGPPTKDNQGETITPGSPDVPYRPTTNGNQDYGDPMELDATRKRPRLNI